MGVQPKLIDLALQGTSMLRSIPRGNPWLIASASRPEGLRFGRAFQDEVPMSFVATICHAEVEFPYEVAFSFNLSAMDLRSSSMVPDVRFPDTIALTDQRVFQHLVRRPRNLRIVQPLPRFRQGKSTGSVLARLPERRALSSFASCEQSGKT